MLEDIEKRCKPIPIYEYQCPTHGRFEKLLPLIPYGKKKTIPCVLTIDCSRQAEKIFSIPANISIGKPTIIFRNPQTGEAEVATMDNDQPPYGYIREELRNPIERSKFEKEETTKKSVENEFHSEAVYRDRERKTKERQAEIRAKMSSYDSQTQSLLTAAMERTRARPFKPKKSEVRLDVNHKNASNMIVERSRKTKTKTKTKASK